jgi:hypothetical protein
MLRSPEDDADALKYVGVLRVCIILFIYICAFVGLDYKSLIVFCCFICIQGLSMLIFDTTEWYKG